GLERGLRAVPQLAGTPPGGRAHPRPLEPPLRERQEPGAGCALLHRGGRADLRAHPPGRRRHGPGPRGRRAGAQGHREHQRGGPPEPGRRAARGGDPQRHHLEGDRAHHPRGAPPPPREVRMSAESSFLQALERARQGYEPARTIEEALANASLAVRSRAAEVAAEKLSPERLVEFVSRGDSYVRRATAMEALRKAGTRSLPAVIAGAQSPVHDTAL